MPRPIQHPTLRLHKLDQMKLRPHRHHALLTKGIDNLPAHKGYHVEPVARFEKGEIVAAEGDDVEPGGALGAVGVVEDALGDALQEVSVDGKDVRVEGAAVRGEEGFVAFKGGPGAEVEGSEVGEAGEAGLGSGLVFDFGPVGL
jgi:hypothetical protein